MTNAINGLGMVLTVNGSAIAQVDTYDGVELVRDKQEATAHDSSGGWTEMVATAKKATDPKITGFFYPGDTNGQIALATLEASGALAAFVFTYPSGLGTVTVSYSALVTAFKPGPVNINKLITFSATLTISGAVTMGITLSSGISALTITGATNTVYPTFANGTVQYVDSSTAASMTFTATFTGTCVLKYGTTPACTGGTMTLTSTVASGAVSLGSAGTLTFVQITETDTGKAPVTYYFAIAKTA